ncbi:MAG: hypothetical protein KDJ52_01705 [Anaerolineae bacterium]|nr:hypothetical protein [Anaerolineae bacterium]
MLNGINKESQYVTINGNGVTVQTRGDTAVNWTASNPVLAAGEIGLETDTQLFKVGDGVTAWDELGYWGGLPEHNHDDLYYTESEVDALLGGKSDVGHDHDDRYYTETEVDGLLAGKSDTNHNHDSRYYTETEVDALLAGKSDTNHNHDSRYYTESEVDALLAGLVGFYRIRGSGNQSISSGGWSVVNFNTNGSKNEDVGGYDAFSSNNTNINMLDDGVYRVVGKVYYYNNTGSACNLLQVRLNVGGSEDIPSRFTRQSDVLSNGGRITVSVEKTIEVVGTEYVYLQIYSDVGGTVILDRSLLEVERLGATPTIGI